MEKKTQHTYFNWHCKTISKLEEEGGGVAAHAQSFSQMRTSANVNAEEREAAAARGGERRDERGGRKKEKSVLKNPAAPSRGSGS